jgi:cytochrome P450
MNRDARPPGPGRLLFLRRHPETFLKLARKYGDLIHFRIGPREIFLVSRPDLFEPMFREYYAHSEKDWGPRRGSTIFGNGLLTSEGGDHRSQRHVFARIFARAEIERRKPAVAEVVEEWSRRQTDGAEVDVVREMSLLMTAISTRLLFGCRIDAASLLAMNGAINRRFRRYMFPYADRLRIRRSFTEQVSKLVSDVKKEGSDDAMLAPMLDGDGLADQQLATFLMAGQEALRIAMSWTLFLLSRHPNVRQRLAGDPSPRFTEQVLNESLRIFPPQWAIGRRTMTPYTIDGYEMPAGSLVLASPYVVHRDMRYFEQPLRFDPGRWDSPPSVRAAYFPFGIGPRRCIGEAFALIVGTMVLSQIASRWMFDCTTEPSYDVRLTLAPANLRAKLRRVSG